MIDTDNLRTASLYINNQLLSRGLLKDGQSIDFANPYDLGNDGDVSATMGRIISVVNDLILRRDRDAEHRESLSTTMRALRADNVKLTSDIGRLKEKHIEAQRRVDIAESSETALKTQLKSAEATIRGLKEDMARARALVAQARTSCATDVRRRDREIDNLKKQLGEAGRARGSRGSSAVTTITVTGNFGTERDSPATISGATMANATADDYSLRNETNAFLADLARNLSEENEAIMQSMQQTMERLRQMSGWTGDDKADQQVVKHPGWEELSSDLSSVVEHMKGILTNPSFVPIEEVMIREEEITRLKTGWVKMESRWREAVHLIEGWRQRMAASGRPVDDEELKMGLRLSPIRVHETRQAQVFDLSAVAEEEDEEGKEAEAGGVEVEEELLDPVHFSPCPVREESLELVPVDTIAEGEGAEIYQQRRETQGYDEAGFYEDGGEVDGSYWQNDGEADEEEDPNVQILQESTGPPHRNRSLESSPLPEPPHLSPLRTSPSAGNRGAANHKKTKSKAVEFTTIVEENTWDLAGDDQPPQPPPHRITPAKHPLAKPGRRIERPRSPSRTSLEEALLPRREEEENDQAQPAETTSAAPSRSARDERDEPVAEQKETPRKTVSRLPLPRNAEAAPQQSPLTMATIAAKLAASEREADAARVRAKLMAARGTRGAKRPTTASFSEPVSKPKPEPPATTSQEGRDELAKEDVDPVKRDLRPSQGEAEQEIKVEKRKRERQTSKVSSRRRSTLSPWELESLISGNVQ